MMVYNIGVESLGAVARRSDVNHLYLMSSIIYRSLSAATVSEFCAMYSQVLPIDPLIFRCSPVYRLPYSSSPSVCASVSVSE